jgi:methylenetetrahydrofolate dehydrogenase (NADP+)/methenyltetrahydrofolate cyclohydrolase
MTASRIDGKAIAASLREDLKARVARLAASERGPPSLRILIVGDDEATHIYAGRLEKAGIALGVTVSIDAHGAETTDIELRRLIETVNADDSIDGVIVGMPLPKHLSSEIVSTCLAPEKDVDGITVVNAGRLYLGGEGHVPSTAASIMEIIKRSGVEIRGKRAVVLGRSPVVGKPVALLLLREHATVTICHTRTINLPSVTREADILVAAAGSAGCITGAMIKPGALVIDAGINAVESGIVGDVDFDSAVAVAGAITPVPGGVGPLTNVLLLDSVVRNAEQRG